MTSSVQRTYEVPAKAPGGALTWAASGVVLGAIALLGSAALASPAGPRAPIALAAAPTAEALPRPAWLERLIAQLAAQPLGNPPHAVWRYRYLGKVVYYLPPQCCDQYSVLFDAQGAVIAAPDGGITGRGDGRAADFHAVRTDGQLLWRDPRAPQQLQRPWGVSAPP